MSQIFNLSLLATWLASATSNNTDNNNGPSYWVNSLFITGLAISMTVNTLVTGMIVFGILKVTVGVEPTSVERSLGSSGGSNTKFRHIIFIIIESGMALFAIQLVRVVLAFAPVPVGKEDLFQAAADIVIAINQMLNVIIIRSLLFFIFYFFC